MPITTKLIVALVSVALFAAGEFAVYEWGYTKGFGVAQTAGNTALSTYKQTAQAAQATAVATANQDYYSAMAKANQAEQALMDATRQLASQSQQIKEQVDAVTHTYRPSPNVPAGPLPQCVFTRGFVRLWNDAIGANNRASAVQGSTAVTVSGTTPTTDDAVNSGLSQADILDWVIDYGARNQSVEKQLNELLDMQQQGQ